MNAPMGSALASALAQTLASPMAAPMVPQAPATPPSNPQANALLPELRSATREHHDRIEQLLQLDGTLTLPRYRLIIAGFHAFLQDWEAAVREALPERLHGWFDARRRAHFAADDMRHLGISESAVARFKAVDVRHQLAGLAAPTLGPVLGSMYVIEGSALGGQVITPRIKQQLGLEPGRGATYFNGYGERTGTMWRDFRQLAEAELAGDPAARQAACVYACRSFDALTRSFEVLLA